MKKLSRKAESLTHILVDQSCSPVRILAVAYQWVTCACKMSPNLVGPAGHEFDFSEGSLEAISERQLLKRTYDGFNILAIAAAQNLHLVCGLVLQE